MWDWPSDAPDQPPSHPPSGVSHSESGSFEGLRVVSVTDDGSTAEVSPPSRRPRIPGHPPWDPSDGSRRHSTSPLPADHHMVLPPFLPSWGSLTEVTSNSTCLSPPALSPPRGGSIAQSRGLSMVPSDCSSLSLYSIRRTSDLEGPEDPDDPDKSSPRTAAARRALRMRTTSKDDPVVHPPPHVARGHATRELSPSSPTPLEEPIGSGGPL
jgi:hypothetical protein